MQGYDPFPEYCNARFDETVSTGGTLYIGIRTELHGMRLNHLRQTLNDLLYEALVPGMLAKLTDTPDEHSGYGSSHVEIEPVECATPWGHATLGFSITLERQVAHDALQECLKRFSILVQRRLARLEDRFYPWPNSHLYLAPDLFDTVDHVLARVMAVPADRPDTSIMMSSRHFNQIAHEKLPRG